jgi:hypothetical protein
MIPLLRQDFWFLLAASAIVVAAGLVVWLSGAHASTGFRTDPFVHLIESQISGASHVAIGPGTTVTIPQCQCSVKYLGTKIEGHLYMVYLDKLD